MASQLSKAPTNKIIATGIAGSVVTIVVWAAKQFGHVDLPPEVAAALTAIISFAAGWLTPPSQQDSVV